MFHISFDEQDFLFPPPPFRRSVFLNVDQPCVREYSSILYVEDDCRLECCAVVMEAVRTSETSGRFYTAHYPRIRCLISFCTLFVLTAWSIALSEQLIVAQLVIFIAFYGTLKFTVVFTRARHCSFCSVVSCHCALRTVVTSLNNSVQF
jgi:hypothetical protein